MSSRPSRKDTINRSEEFLASAFNGVSATRNDRISVSRVTSVLASFVIDEDPEPSKYISRNDMHNASILVENQPRLGLSRQEANIIYLRAYCKLPWKAIAENHNLSWYEVRQKYEQVLADMYYAFVRDKGR